jgi:hypothetical protein
MMDDGGETEDGKWRMVEERKGAAGGGRFLSITIFMAGRIHKPSKVR